MNYFDLTGYKSTCLLTSLKACLRHLNLLEFILKNILASLKAFYKNCEFHLFDPHVGDTMCQIRAMLLLHINKETKINEDYVKAIVKLLIKVEKIKSQLECLQNHKTNRFEIIILEKFFLDNELYFYLPDEVQVLFLSYVLTLYKNFHYHFDSRIDIERLMGDLNIGKSSVVRLYENFQILISDMSVRFLKIKLPKYSEVINYFCKKDLVGRCVLPCFLIADLLIEILKQSQYNILLIVRSKNSKQCVALKFQCEKNRPALIFHCHSELSLLERKEFSKNLNYNVLMKIFLQISAYHQQYSQSCLVKSNENIYENSLEEKMIRSNDFTLSYMKRLLLTYKTSKMLHEIDVVDHSHELLCEIEHISLGTKKNYESIYYQLDFGEIIELKENIEDKEVA